jgi:hypothetical protein
LFAVGKPQHMDNTTLTRQYPIIYKRKNSPHSHKAQDFEAAFRYVELPVPLTFP